MNILNSGRFSMGSTVAGMLKKLIGEWGQPGPCHPSPGLPGRQGGPVLSQPLTAGPVQAWDPGLICREGCTEAALRGQGSHPGMHRMGGHVLGR